jgi:hypothetical protein
MALSNVEKVRAFRQRQKALKDQNLRAPQAHVLAEIFKTPFFEFLEHNGNTSDFEQTFDMMGLDAPEFSDDSGPKSTSGSFENIPELRDRIYPPTGRSLDRAELMVGCLLDAATTLAGIVNSFKRQQIDIRITELTEADFPNSEQKHNAVAQIVALTKMRDQLDKDLRWPVRQWRVGTDVTV